MRLHDLCLLEDFPEHIEPWNKQLHGILGEEVRYIPRQITGVSIKTGEDKDPDQRNISTVWLEVAIVWQLLAVKSLRSTGAMKEDVSDTHGDVVDQTCSILIKKSTLGA